MPAVVWAPAPFPLEAAPISRNVSIPTHQLLEDPKSTEKTK